MMAEFNPYTFLFSDAFYGSLFFVPPNSYAFIVMLYSGLYNIKIIFSISVCASSLASICNYLIGRIIRYLEKYEFLQDRSESLLKVEKMFKAKGMFLLIFSCVPLWGAFITTASGVLRVNPYIAFSLSLASHIIYYSYDVYFR